MTLGNRVPRANKGRQHVLSVDCDYSVCSFCSCSVSGPSHPMERRYATVCKYGGNCNKSNCRFQHPERDAASHGPAPMMGGAKVLSSSSSVLPSTLSLPPARSLSTVGLFSRIRHYSNAAKSVL